MGTLFYIFALIWIGVIGYLVLRCLNFKQNIFYRLEYYAYAFLLGLIVLPSCIFTGALFGMPFVLGYIASLLIFVTVTLLAYIFIKKIPKVSYMATEFEVNFSKLTSAKRYLIFFVGLWVVVKVVIGGINIFTTPTYVDDAHGNWNTRAKNWYYSQNLILDQDNSRFLGGGYVQYPPGVSVVKTYFAIFYGNWHEGIINSISFFIYIITGIIIFFALYRESSSLILSTGGVYALTSIPLLHIHGTNPYFDLFMGLYFFIAIYSLFLFFQGKIDYRLPMIFLGLLAYTKSEGLIIFLTTSMFCLWAGIGLQLIYKKNRKLIIPALKITIGTVIITLPFLLFKAYYGLGFGNGNASVIESISNFTLHYEIIKPYYMVLFFGGSFHLFFFFFVIGTLFHFWKIWKDKNWEQMIFHASFFTAFAIIFLIYLTTFTFQYVLDQTGVNRSLIQLLPVGIFALLYPFSKFFHDSKN